MGLMKGNQKLRYLLGLTFILQAYEKLFWYFSQGSEILQKSGQVGCQSFVT